LKLKTWSIIGTLFLMSCGLWTTYIISSRAFLRDFNAGVHSYLSGQFVEAEQSLRDALTRRPHSAQVSQLLTKVLIERSFAQYHQKNYAAALETLDRASQTAAADEPTRETFRALREQLGVPADKRPVNIEQVLDGLYKHLPARDQPNSLQAMMEQYLRRTQLSQEALLKHFWDNQEHWLVQLEQQKEQFKRILYGGLLLFGAGGILLIVSLVGVLHAYFGRRGVFARLLEAHYERVVAALPAGSNVLLGPPVSLHRVPEAQQMDIIEAEIISGRNEEESAKRLQSFLAGEDPWVRARAAKILYRLDPKLSLQELKRLVSDASNGSQVPGMWALSELATSEALDLLVPLAYSPSREIQQGAIRSLLQLQTKEHLPEPVRQKLNTLLPEIRSRTGWVF
jgi:hypothetical protein